ncbi:HAD-IIA family hydrolase [Sinomonas sp. ASV322]|uniref:HAD-IIA family hydrolase n=1 Tax=Sinomonas sp. ASV322 TaxID=3041920 RepID=UPI0027DE27EF|nr:HAD-IIA family hydrolase [Sinomonas sp. ASV322]MDQ4500693.1 HAD-IIA family hydrolase [Sinomonas sp. ASV322]
MRAAFIDAFDAVLSDLDGVVYAGPHAIPGAPEALRGLASRGVRLGYVTNNASRSPAEVAAHLRELGAPAEENDVVSSAQAGAELLARKVAAGSRVLVTGSAALAHEVEIRGLVPVRSAQDGPVAVIQGFSPDLGWRDLAEASYAVAAGAVWVATNTDWSIPQARGMAPGNGTLVHAVRAATGKEPLVAGKPEAPLFLAAAERLGAKRPVVVGDRLDTDILGGNRAGFATAAVLTGVDTPETILAARTAERPGYILATLSDLYAPYPDVEAVDGGWRAGGSTARVDGRVLRVSGARGDLDAWRAACAAWWDARPHADEAAAPELVWED